MLLRVPPGWIGDSRPSPLGGNSPVAQAEDSSTRAFRKGRTARTPPLYAPTPKSCCSRWPLPRLCRGICSSPSLCLSPAHPRRREPVGSCLEPQGEPGHLSPLSHLVVARASGGGAGENKEALSQLWYLYLMLLFPTRQAGVSSHHPNQLQAARTTKASSSVTTSQVSKAICHQCLPCPSLKPLPSLLPLFMSFPICLILGEVSPAP